jgi:hypothetical protein
MSEGKMKWEEAVTLATFLNRKKILIISFSCHKVRVNNAANPVYNLPVKPILPDLSPSPQ